MSKAVITESILDDIADAIIAKGGASAALTPLQMPAAIANIPAGGSSPWKHIITQEVAVTTTSTSAATAATINCGTEIVTGEKIVWVHIRDKAGPRAGYCYGSDAFFVNANKANGTTTTFTTPGVNVFRVSTAGLYATTAGQYGVYGYSISNAGALIVRRRYNSSYSLTIDGTYVVDVYTLDLPDGLTLFE